MSKTKKLILEKSLELFNSKGISNVSLRDIADKSDISIGNLQYHFKKRKYVIESLYFQLVNEIDNVIFINEESLLKSFFLISTKMLTMFFEYRFFLLDFVFIIRNNEKIRNHYSELSKKREKEFLTIANIFIENDVFRKEILKNEYYGLYKRTEVISNFWFSTILIQNNKLSLKAINEYSFLVSQSIYPYLTNKTKEEYKSIFNSQFI